MQRSARSARSTIDSISVSYEAYCSVVFQCGGCAKDLCSLRIIVVRNPSSALGYRNDGRGCVTSSMNDV